MTGLRVGIAGYGRGASYARAFTQMQETDVYAVCDQSEKARGGAREQGFARVVGDFGDLLVGEVDVIVIATPPQDHLHQVCAALEAGKHVLSEVPAVQTIEECHALQVAVEKAAARGLKYMLAENACYMDTAEIARQMVLDGKFGEIYYAEGDYLAEARYLLYNEDGSATWRGRYPGILYTTHHLGPILRMVRDRVNKAVCLDTGPCRFDASLPRSDVQVALFNTERQALVKFRADYVSYRPNNNLFISVQGDRGALEAPRGLGDEAKVYVVGESPPREWEPLTKYANRYLSEEWRNVPEWTKAYWTWAADYRVATAFVQCILRGTPPPITVYDALNWTAPGICAVQSVVNGGRPVLVPVFAGGP
ncbi:MAG: Gfo/Idh/MocA family protein [Chloroflexota bacterium]